MEDQKEKWTLVKLATLSLHNQSLHRSRFSLRMEIDKGQVQQARSLTTIHYIKQYFALPVFIQAASFLMLAVTASINKIPIRQLQI